MSSGLRYDDITRHPVADLVVQLRARLGELADFPLLGVGPEDLRSVVPELTRARAQLTELKLRVALQADRCSVGDEVGASNTQAWWANVTRQTRSETHRLLRLAESLDTGHQPTRTALASGSVLVDQALVIVDAVDALPADLVDPELREQAETTLVGYAADHDAKGLRILGRRILDVLAPEIGEEHERRQLEVEEAKARRASSFTMSDDGHGSAHGRFTIPSLHGEMLCKALLAIAAPARARLHDPSSSTQRVAGPLRMGQALIEYVERYPAGDLPQAGGTSATVVVTMTLDALLGGAKAASLDTGGVISASEARRLVCEAAIIPAVLGGGSQVLDLGRTRRLHSRAQRIALSLRDGGCTAVGCDWPPGMCHAHHDLPWSSGGPTTLDNGRLLCARHHAHAHDTHYAMTQQDNGKVAFHRRT